MDIKPISVIQANVNRQYNAQHELIQTFMSKDYSIAIVCEPYVGSGPGVHSIQGVDIHQFTSGDRVKACVLIKQTFGTSLGVTQLSTTNLAVVKIKLRQRTLFIASAYIEPDTDTNHTYDAITKFLIDTRGSHIILAGDLNGHHTE